MRLARSGRVLPPHEVYTILRKGFSPLGAPQQRGFIYTIAVVDRGGEDGRLVIDARSGRILRFVRAWQNGASYDGATNSAYGPPGPLPPTAASRTGPRPPESVSHVASRSVPVPKPSPLAGKPVAKPAEAAAKPAAEAPSQQAAVTQATPAEAAAAATPATVARRKSRPGRRRRSCRHRTCRAAGAGVAKSKNAPVSRGAFVSAISAEKPSVSGGDFAVDDLRGRLAGRNRNAAGLLGLGDLAHEIDMEQAVLKRGVLHLHEVGKLEHPLEGARGDTAIEHFGFVLAVLVGDFLALDRQRVFLRDDGKLVLREAGDGNRDAVGVLAGPLDIVGGIAGAAVEVAWSSRENRRSKPTVER